MGGIWEWQICIICKVFIVLLYEYGFCLDDEFFRILLCEVEVIINFRLLIFVLSDFDDFDLLSFSNFLIMKISVVFFLVGVF